MSGAPPVLLPPLSLPRLSDSGTLVGGATAFTSTGSISSRYASMRAAGAAAQGALSARVPRPAQLPAIDPTPTAAAAAAAAPPVAAGMSFETAASAELQVLNANRNGLGSGAPRVVDHALLLLLPGYEGGEAFLTALRTRLANGDDAGIERDEQGREAVRRFGFTQEQADQFCDAGEPIDSPPVAVEDEAADSPSAVDSDTLLTAPPAPSSLVGGVTIAVHVFGVGVLRSLARWVDDQDQRAYIYMSPSASAAAREIELVFTQFRAPLQSTLALVKPDAIASGYYPSILRRIESEGFEVARVEESLRFTESQAKHFYAEHLGKAFYPLLVKFMCSGPLVALVLRRENAISAWRQLIGSTSDATSLRGLYATDGTRNAVHGSDSPAAATREVAYIFDKVAPLSQSTFALIKPDGMSHRDAILERLAQEGFDLTRIQHIDRLSTEQARLFFTKKHMWQHQSPPVEKEKSTAGAATTAADGSSPLTARRTVSPVALPTSDDRPDFDLLLESLQKGPCLALELRRAQAVRHLRLVAGGSAADNVLDPQVARGLDGGRSLRALHGRSVLHNVLYASSTLDDASRDLSVFFTSRDFFPPVEQTFLLVKPDAVAHGHADEIAKRLARDDFRTVRQKKLLLTPAQVDAFFPSTGDVTDDALGGVPRDEFVNFLTSGPVVAMHLKRANAVSELRRVCGALDSDAPPTPAGVNPLDALRVSAPQSLRALYGADARADAVYAASSAREASRLVDFVFHQWYPELESTFAFVKPDAYAVKGAAEAILNRARQEGFEVVRRSKVHLSRAQAKLFYAEHVGRIFQPALVDFMTSGPALAFELRKIDAIKSWRALLGPTNSLTAKAEAPNSLRALFGTDGRRNACHGSDSAESASREIGLVFDQFVPLIETTCCLLKPESLVNNVAKSMLRRIVAEGFEVVKQEKMTLTPQQAMRFWAEHAGSLYFPDLLAYMTSGPVIALALRKENAVADFRALMGTTDSTVARRTQPTTLRGLYGTDKKFNAVHGSESREAAKREVDLAFNTFSVGVQDTFAWIKPDASSEEEAITQRLVEEGFTILKRVKRVLTAGQVRAFYAELSSAPFFDALVRYMISGPVIGLILRKENAVRALRELCGPTSAIEAKATDPDSLRALFGTDALRNALHSSKSPDAARRELDQVRDFFVGLQNTLALLKPDAIAKQAEGPIMEAIRQQGFDVLRKKALSFTQEQARTFYEVHKEQPFFEPLIEFMTSGPCIALEIRKDDAIKSWRAMLGPTDSTRAKREAPESIRALYGTDGRMNAAHGSDSPEAAARECSLIFDQFSSMLLTTLAILKPDAVKKGVDELMVKRITDAGFELIARKKLKLSSAQVKQLYLNDASKPFFKAASEFMTSGPVVCLALRKNSALTELQTLVGAENPKAARKSAPQSLRALFGTDVNRNAIHCPASMADNAREVALLFGEYNLDLLG